MNLQQRKALLIRLGQYMQLDETSWQAAKKKATEQNAWFIPEFIDLAAHNISQQLLTENVLEHLVAKYSIPDENTNPKKVGVVMAGNIPMVGFHDLFSTFLTGHHALIKVSSRDEVLITHFVEKMVEWDANASDYLQISYLLKNCDAYIATGSNNTSRYFEYYFRNHPTIIRKNRTSVALLEGNESPEELSKLADDVYQYFGLGCRNVTKIFVPQEYDFVPLLEAFAKYNYLINHNKYKNNYDYNLALHLLNYRYYMTNGSILLVEDKSSFSPISQLHFERYANADEVRMKLLKDDSIQCVVGKHSIPFGEAQCPAAEHFADGIDTIRFLLQLPSEVRRP
jgi:hypothetical protein